MNEVQHTDLPAWKDGESLEQWVARLYVAGWQVRIGPPCGNPIFDSGALIQLPPESDEEPA